MIEKQAMTELIWRLSHPSWVRGLKYRGLEWPGHDCRRTLHGCVDWNAVVPDEELAFIDVAPFMGAWIEMPGSRAMGAQYCVAPFMGAWIEMFSLPGSGLLIGCRTLHGCVDWNVDNAGLRKKN